MFDYNKTIRKIDFENTRNISEDYKKKIKIKLDRNVSSLIY